jgi:hypothetical protein
MQDGDEEEVQAVEEEVLSDEAKVEAEPAPDYLTTTQFNELMTQQQRWFQSQLDRRDTRLEKKYQELQTRNAATLEVARQTGMAPEALAAFQKRLEEDAVKRTMTPDAQPNPQVAPQPQAPVPDMEAVKAQVSAIGGGIAAKYKLEDTDPEAKMININSSPEDYFASIVMAGEAKKARLASNGAPARAPALAPAGRESSRNPIEKINNVSELYQQGVAEMKKKRQAG